MEALPREIVRVLRIFEDAFSERVWDWVQVLVVGAILTPGQRTVAAVLRVMGLSDEQQFQNSHRVLNRACWASWELRRRLLLAVVAAFVPSDGPVVVADSTYAVLELLADSARLSQPVTVVTRLRLDAALYDPVPTRMPGTLGRPTDHPGTATDVGDTPARSCHDLGETDRPLVRRRDCSALVILLVNCEETSTSCGAFDVKTTSCCMWPIVQRIRSQVIRMTIGTCAASMR
jgi:hypothetical protein